MKHDGERGTRSPFVLHGEEVVGFPLPTACHAQSRPGLALYTFSGHMDLSWATLFVVTISFVCELVDSSLGMGYGTTLTPLLLLFGVDPRVLVPTILLSELASGFSASAFHHGHGNVDFVRHALHRRTAIILSLCSVVGVVLGVQVALGVSRVFLTRLIGVIVLGAGIFIIAARGRFAYRTWKIMALGMGAAFNKAVSGGGYGPLLTSGQVLAGMAGKPAIAITSPLRRDPVILRSQFSLWTEGQEWLGSSLRAHFVRREILLHTGSRPLRRLFYGYDPLPAGEQGRRPATHDRRSCTINELPTSEKE